MEPEVSSLHSQESLSWARWISKKCFIFEVSILLGCDMAHPRRMEISATQTQKLKNSHTLIKIILHAFYAFWGYFMFLSPIFHKFWTKQAFYTEDGCWCSWLLYMSHLIMKIKAVPYAKLLFQQNSSDRTFSMWKPKEVVCHDVLCVCHSSQTSCYQRNLCHIFCIFCLSYQEKWFHACVELLSQWIRSCIVHTV